MSPLPRDHKLLAPVLLFVALALLPFAAGTFGVPFYVTVVTRFLIFAIAASALNLIMGYAGLISLGHALFFGLGVYAVGICSYYGIGNVFAHIAAVIVLTGVVGFVTGLVSLRTSGIAFIMITLAFAQMGYFVFIGLSQFGGDNGMTVDHVSQLFGASFATHYVLYGVTFAALLALTIWSAKLRKAPFGMVLRGGRINPRRVPALGIPLRKYQLVAYVISAIITGFAGMLFADLTAYASPSSMNWILSGDLIVMVVMGGVGTVMGPIYGALAFLILKEILRAQTTHWMAILGPIIVLIALYRYHWLGLLVPSRWVRWIRPASKSTQEQK